MSVVQLLALASIGAGVGALTYYSFFRNSKKTELREESSLLEIPITTFNMPFSGTEEKIQAPATAAEKIKNKSPIRGACAECKEVATLPFRCKFCSELFCGTHRLPENHDCDAL